MDVIQDDDSATGITKYQNGLGIDNKLRMENGSDVNYFLSDQLGSTNGLVNQSGNLTSSASYDSFGNSTGNLATRYQFTGRERDELTGLYYFRARWYDSKLGRFTTEDPIGFGGKQINLYGYLGNSPMLASDPLGLYPDKPVNYLRDPVSHDSFYNFGGLTNGTSNTVSDLLSLDYVAELGWTIGDYRCSTYDRVKAGVILGGVTIVSSGGGKYLGKGFNWIRKGEELVPFGNDKTFRIALFGNRTKPPHPYGRFPHYHRKGRVITKGNKKGQTVPGQTIKRHRPFEPHKSDTSFWDRF